MKFSIHLLLTLFFVLVACKDDPRGGDQQRMNYNNDGIGGTYAVGQRDQNLKENYENTFNRDQSSQNQISKNPCLNEFTGSNHSLKSLEEIVNNVENKIDCNKACPNNYSILRRKETPFNRLAFINARCNFNHGFGGGVCTGIVKTMQAFHHLAFWDEEKTEVYTKQSCGNKVNGEMSSQCLYMYRQKIKAILHQKQAVDIPGFSNLFEFSSHPAIQDMMKAELVKLERDVWNPQSYNQNHIVNDLNNFKRPFLYVNNNHGIWAWKKEVKNGREVICVRDPNDPPPSRPKINGSSCDDYIYQTGNSWKRVHKGRNIRIGPVKSIRSDNISHQAYQASVRRHCLQRCNSK